MTGRHLAAQPDPATRLRPCCIGPGLTGGARRPQNLERFGEVGENARLAVGMAELPFNLPVEIEAEIGIAS